MSTTIMLTGTYSATAAVHACAQRSSSCIKVIVKSHQCCLGREQRTSNDRLCGLAGSVAGSHLYPRDQRIPLHRGRAGQEDVLQGRRQLVAVERHHPVIVVPCRPGKEPNTGFPGC